TSKTVTVDDTSYLSVGMSVAELLGATGTTIAAGTTVASITDSTHFVLSKLPLADITAGSLTTGTTFNLPGATVKNRLVVPSIAGITKGMIISNVGGPLDLAIVSNMGTTAAVVANPAAVPPVVGSDAFDWIEVIKKDATAASGYAALDVTTAAFTSTSTSSFSIAGRKTLDKLSNSVSLSATDATYLTPTSDATLTSPLVLGDPVSGQGIPPGTFIGKITTDPVTGLKNVSLVDAKNNAVFPTSDSYGSVQLAFKNQVITISDFPVTDSYSNVTVSLGNAYRPAASVGDIRISFNEYDQMTLPDAAIPADYTFVGTDGKPLDGITLQAARAASPKIRTFNVGTSGDINIVLSNGQTFTAGAVLLQMFKDPGALTREGDNLFTGLYTAGPYNGRFEPSNIAGLTPSRGGLGAINGGALELSNVDLGEEFSTMITTQRAFQAGSRVITTTDQMMEEAVNLKR
ncbi:MAG: Flagellar hook protein FlgE, partial [Verrucomicrobia bacterium]